MKLTKPGRDIISYNIFDCSQSVPYKHHRNPQYTIFILIIQYILLNILLMRGWWSCGGYFLPNLYWLPIVMYSGSTLKETRNLPKILTPSPTLGQLSTSADTEYVICIYTHTRSTTLKGRKIRVQLRFHKRRKKLSIVEEENCAGNEILYGLS